MTQESASYRLSRYAHVYAKEGITAFYHSLRQDLFLIRASFEDVLHECGENGRLAVNVRGPASADALVRGGILIRGKQDDELLLAEKMQEAGIGTVDIQNLKLILTERCNLRCEYCVIEGNLRHQGQADMSAETVEQALAMFARHTHTSAIGSRIIMLYGGEPLLNREVLKHAVLRSREMESDGEFGGPVGIVLETNGTLMTPDMASFLAKNDVLVQVSIDGPAHVHDMMRRTCDGQGSHAAAEKGFRLARDSGAVCVVSAVFGNHTASHVDEVMDYFVSDLKPLTIGLDLLHLIQGSRNPGSIPRDQLVAAYLRAWELARESGLYVEHVVRRIRPFVEGRIRWQDCPSCGSRMVVRPDGNVGTCEAFLATGEFFGEYLNAQAPLGDDTPFAQWSTRSAVNADECQSCPALAICGGGCPYNAWVRFRDLHGRDEKVCLTSKALIDWAIHEVMALPSVRQRLQDNALIAVAPTERAQIFKEVPLRHKVVLQMISDYSEGAPA